jgi:hypothetical protein
MQKFFGLKIDEGLLKKLDSIAVVTKRIFKRTTR